MNCCIYCFNSDYLKDIVYSYSSGLDDCSYCGATKIPTCDPKVLEPQFRNICELYSPAVSAGSGNLIQNQIHSDFPNQIFSFSDSSVIESILRDIFQDVLTDFENMFESEYELSCKVDPVSIGYADDLKVSWDRFVEEIKNENRYHIKNKFDLSKLENLLKRYEGKYPVGKILYRARISDKSGYPKDRMGNPPNDKAGHGRANPEGISYLYLSNDIQTTLYETRAYLFDYVCIGKFRSLQEVKTIKLQIVNDYDPVQLAETESLTDFIIYLPFISHLSLNLSKPVRRKDNKLDYYPTQYLSEFIKSLGYDGIEYGSSLNPSGYNIAFFDPTKFMCVETTVKEIDDIQFSHRSV